MKCISTLPGGLVISLDYELMWGMIDLPNASVYGRTNVVNVQRVICEMLNMFEKYQVKATFATVGMLMCNGMEELNEIAPTQTPSYSKEGLTPYGNYQEYVLNAEPCLFFAPISIDQLKQSPLVEIGTHTFCHYYCWEEGQNIEQFEADLKAAIRIAKHKEIELKSIVFPRNNVNEDYLSICYKNGIISYRGNAVNFFGKNKSNTQFRLRRFCRWLDTYLPIVGYTTYKYDNLYVKDGTPINIPASRFFRPYNRYLSIIEPLRLARIKNEMKHAARNMEMYHLWWHPHNFGANMKENLDNLESVLKYFSYCREKYGMQSYTMNELSEILIKKYGKQ